METVVVEKGMVVVVHPHKKYRHNKAFIAKVLRIFRNQFWVEGTHSKFWIDDLSHYKGEYTLSVQEWMPCHTHDNTYSREDEPMFHNVHWMVVDQLVRRIEPKPIWFFGLQRYNKCNDLHIKNPFAV